MKANARLLFRVGGTVVLFYAAVLVLLAGCQSQMIYFPTTRSEPAVRREAAAAGFRPWEAAAGRLIGWRSPGGAGANRLVVFCGNAGMALHRDYFRAGLRAVGDGQWEVFVMEYPGYGARPGSPGESSFAAAGREALQELEREGSRRVFLLGESIGSGVAAHLAGEFPDKISGLVLITPFTSLADAAVYHYPWLPVRLLLRDRYDNQAALAKFRGPLAVVLAGRDRIVPAALGRRLAKARKVCYDPRQCRCRLRSLCAVDSAGWRGDAAPILLSGSP